MADGERIRLFCALQLAAASVRCLAAWQSTELGRDTGNGGRLVPAENLHITLAFLGSRAASDVPGVAAELRAAVSDAGKIELRPSVYREAGRVGMLVLRDLNGAAGALAHDLQERLEQRGLYRRERRPWLPHITVLRFREPAGLSPEVANRCSIHVVRSAVYRSLLGAGGAHYNVLETAALGGR